MIQFNVGKKWGERDVALRVAVIIGEVNAYAYHKETATPTLYCPYKKDNGSWQLDGPNNWFLRKISDDQYGGTYELEYRYRTPEKQLALDGLKVFLENEVFE